MALLVTIAFWGLWTYFVMPLVSLLLWFLGIYLFVDRMISMGGYRAFADELVNYSTVVFVMWLLLSLWVLWNQIRYGRNERRTVRPPRLSEARLGKAMGMSADEVVALQAKKEIALHFESESRPAVEWAN